MQCTLFHDVGRAGTVALVAIAGASDARGADWWVDQAYANCASSNGSQAQPFCTIGAAVAVAVDGDTIWILPGTYAESLVVTADLSFVGTQGAAATAIDGGDTVRVMKVSGASVSLSGLTIQYGNGNNPSEPGGGLHAVMASVTLLDCDLRFNRCGLSCDQSSLVMSGCTVADNWTVSSAPGGGLLAYSSSLLSVADCLFERNSAYDGGAICATGLSGCTIERCTFRRNHAKGYGYNGGQGGALVGEDVTLVDCLFDTNTAESVQFGPNGFGGNGGAALLGGTCSLVRCRFVANVADWTWGQSVGGAIYLTNATVDLLDCELVDNGCGSSIAGSGGYGGGLFVQTGSKATLRRCTVAGNRADGSGTVTVGGAGGGILAYGTVPVKLRQTIVAGNSAANANGATDVDLAFVTTLDWNVIGDSEGKLPSGSGPHDLLDVDPLFVDPANGDWSLQPTSPAVETGDPTIPLGGMDGALGSRVVDGDLDRTLVIDRGAREFSHVRLAVTGTFAPGGTLTVDTTGTAGLALFLFAGTGQSELAFKPYGSLFVDLNQPYDLVGWGVIPSSVPVAIDPALAVPLTLHVQAVALSGRAGNLSNLVSFTIE